jgi:hypothetical protein
MEAPEINQHIYRHIVYDERAQKLHWRKNSLFNKWYWEN